MLKRAFVTGLLIFTSMTSVAYADPTANPTNQAGCDESDQYGNCVVEVREPGSESGASNGQQPTAETSMCTTPSGGTTDCWQDGKRYFSGYGYCRPLASGRSVDDWRADGDFFARVDVADTTDTSVAIYECDGALLAFEGGDISPPDPAVVARNAIARLQMRAIDIGIAPQTLESDPESLGVVGLPVWLWAETPEAATTGPLTTSVTERGYSVSLAAELKHITWDLGDGSKPITCDTGEPFNPETMDVLTPVECGLQEGYQAEGEYTITATSVWEVNWQGIGQSGVIPFQLSTSGTVRVGEIQVVVTNP